MCVKREIVPAKKMDNFLFFFLDVNECESSPCDQSTELCSNTAGSYACKCLQGLVRSGEGKCVPDANLDEAGQKKSKKKRKSKKGAGSKNTEQQQPGAEDDITRVVFPWYHIMLPLVLLWIVYKYSQPSLYTSLFMTFSFLAAGLIGNKMMQFNYW